MRYIVEHILEDGFFGGTGFALIETLGFGRVRSECESRRLVQKVGGVIVLGWFFTNLVGIVFWAGVVAAAASFL